MESTKMITHLHKTGLISDLDRHFSRFLMKTAPHPNSELEIVAVLVCALMREGHICLNLDQLAGERWPDEKASPSIQCPGLDSWCDAPNHRACSRFNVLPDAPNHTPLAASIR